MADILKPNFYIDDAGLKKLVQQGNWRINEIDLPTESGIRNEFGIDSSVCVLGSGVLTPPLSRKAEEVIAGIDWVRVEDKPKPGEPDFNVYHFVITTKTKEGYPVFYVGK